MGMFSVDLAPAGHTLVYSVSVVCISHIYPCGIVLVFFCNALISLLSFSTFSRAFSCFSFFLGCTLRCVKIISLHQNLGHEAFFFFFS